jgi:hypothetical protein
MRVIMQFISMAVFATASLMGELEGDGYLEVNVLGPDTLCGLIDCRWIAYAYAYARAITVRLFCICLAIYQAIVAD